MNIRTHAPTGLTLATSYRGRQTPQTNQQRPTPTLPPGRGQGSALQGLILLVLLSLAIPVQAAPLPDCNLGNSHDPVAEALHRLSQHARAAAQEDPQYRSHPAFACLITAYLSLPPPSSTLERYKKLHAAVQKDAKLKQLVTNTWSHGRQAKKKGSGIYQRKYRKAEPYLALLLDDQAKLAQAAGTASGQAKALIAKTYCPPIAANAKGLETRIAKIRAVTTSAGDWSMIDKAALDRDLKQYRPASGAAKTLCQTKVTATDIAKLKKAYTDKARELSIYVWRKLLTKRSSIRRKGMQGLASLKTQCPPPTSKQRNWLKTAWRTIDSAASTSSDAGLCPAPEQFIKTPREAVKSCGQKDLQSAITNLEEKLTDHYRVRCEQQAARTARVGPDAAGSVGGKQTSQESGATDIPALLAEGKLRKAWQTARAAKNMADDQKAKYGYTRQINAIGHTLAQLQDNVVSPTLPPAKAWSTLPKKQWIADKDTITRIDAALSAYRKPLPSLSIETFATDVQALIERHQAFRQALADSIAKTVLEQLNAVPERQPEGLWKPLPETEKTVAQSMQGQLDMLNHVFACRVVDSEVYHPLLDTSATQQNHLCPGPSDETVGQAQTFNTLQDAENWFDSADGQAADSARLLSLRNEILLQIRKRGFYSYLSHCFLARQFYRRVDAKLRSIDTQYAEAKQACAAPHLSNGLRHDSLPLPASSGGENNAQ